jgi:hypothetical protein
MDAVAEVRRSQWPPLTPTIRMPNAVCPPTLVSWTGGLMAASMCGTALVRLETNQALEEAITMYRAHGYREVAPFNDEYYAHHWFEKAL